MCQVRVQGQCLVGAVATGFTGDPASLARDNMFFGGITSIYSRAIMLFIIYVQCILYPANLAIAKLGRLTCIKFKNKICPVVNKFDTIFNYDFTLRHKQRSLVSIAKLWQTCQKHN